MQTQSGAFTYQVGTNDLTQTTFGLSRDDSGTFLGDYLSQGICGEHGGDPASIAFCETVGLDYVSCSPFRVPVARLAAAQAAVRAKGGAAGSSTA